MTTTYRTVTTAADVDEEVYGVAEDIVEGFYDDDVDWTDVWDRMDGTVLSDGALLDMGDSIGTPAMKKIQRAIRRARRDG